MQRVRWVGQRGRKQRGKTPAQLNARVVIQFKSGDGWGEVRMSDWGKTGINVRLFLWGVTKVSVSLQER